MSEEMNLDAARQALADARRKSVEECNQEIRQSLEKHKCTMITYQEWVNGTPKGPAQIVIQPVD